MVADVLEELRKLGGFQLRRIMKYFPRQNGVVERFVQETKQVLLKWAKGDFSGWEYYIPAIQMGLNDRIILRHRSRPFSVMFGRRMNKFENFDNDLDEGELVKKAQEWGSKLWEILAKEGGEKGDRDCEATNNKKSGSRTCQTLKVGDWVVQEVQKRNSKLGERWEGPYEVKGFDEERGGYSLQELDGRLLKDLSPIEHLKVVEKALDKEQAYEVEKIVGHRGGVNDREYQIKWKGYDELSWERREMFNEVKIIEDYWSKLIHALYRWRHIVFGFKIIALVDHSSLTYIGTLTNYMVLNWLNFLQQFDLTVVHRPGFKHIVPDALSHLYELAPVPERQPSHRSPSRPLDPSTAEKPPGPSKAPDNNPRQDKRPKHLAQACDPEEVLVLSTNLVDSLNPSEAASLARLFGKRVLQKKDPGSNSERRTIVHEAHHNGPHENATNLQKRLFFKGDFWWPTLYDMCCEVCESCEACLRHNIVC